MPGAHGVFPDRGLWFQLLPVWSSPAWRGWGSLRARGRQGKARQPSGEAARVTRASGYLSGVVERDGMLTVRHLRRLIQGSEMCLL